MVYPRLRNVSYGGLSFLASPWPDQGFHWRRHRLAFWAILCGVSVLGQNQIRIVNVLIQNGILRSGVEFVPFGLEYDVPDRHRKWSWPPGCVRRASSSRPRAPRRLLSPAPQTARLQALASDFWPVPEGSMVRTGQKSDRKRSSRSWLRTPRKFQPAPSAQTTSSAHSLGGVRRRCF